MQIKSEAISRGRERKLARTGCFFFPMGGRSERGGRVEVHGTLVSGPERKGSTFEWHPRTWNYCFNVDPWLLSADSSAGKSRGDWILPNGSTATQQNLTFLRLSFKIICVCWGWSPDSWSAWRDQRILGGSCSRCSWASQHGYWDPNSNSLQKKYMFSSTEPSLWPSWMNIIRGEKNTYLDFSIHRIEEKKMDWKSHHSPTPPPPSSSQYRRCGSPCLSGRPRDMGKNNWTRFTPFKSPELYYGNLLKLGP